MNGQWSGPIEPKKEPQEGKSESFAKTEMLHIEGTELGWLDRKEIEFEGLVYLDPIHEKSNELRVKTYYYASKGNEVYGGGLTVLRWVVKK